MTEKLYTCSECHRKEFKAIELVGHRCEGCRAKRVELRKQIGSIIPWKAEGLERAKRVGRLGPQGGPEWKPRKRRIKKPRTIVLLAKNERLPTWNDNWKPKKPKGQLPLPLKKSKKRKGRSR
jgi:DNA-directed RNA polymerase subunit RPC12/RpoP